MNNLCVKAAVFMLITMMLSATGCSIIDEGSPSSAKKTTTLTAPIIAANTLVSSSEARKYDFYTVRRGDTLQKIADKFSIAKADLLQSNNLKAPDPLTVGQKLRIPLPSSLQQQALLAEKEHTLLWPANGKVVRAFVLRAKGGGSKGINIAGALGQDVRASAAGKVVYSGSNLTGYGKTVIIKHNENIVTVYALNKAVLVKDGQMVKAGEKIAEMGNNAHGDVMLHFEVRVGGKPRNPLLYLEKK